MGIEEVETYPELLGIDLESEEGRFRWFLASILFGKRISPRIAESTYRAFEKNGLTDQERLMEAGWDKLVEVLDQGGYVRYNHSTASKLLEICEKLLEEYGSLEELHRRSKSPRDLEKKLQGFKGIGPTTASIFLRELRGIWEKAKPKLSPPAEKAGKKLGLTGEEMEAQEPRLVRVYLEFCKGKNCEQCPVKEFCRESYSS